MEKVELLAPAGTADLARTAVDFGADAVYIGAGRFGARAAAGNSVEEIAYAVEYAHRYRARLYATLNTILFDSELKEAEQQARELIAAGVDALIIQDMAYLEMDLQTEFHASTQMHNVDPQQIRFLEEVGFRRVILERGLTLEQIAAIREATSIELESFVHGAICVCESGRCVMSRTMSERSGNRGDCSQPCRLTYDLVCENGDVVAKSKYILSLYDMDFRAKVGKLLDFGVRSLKIEGRLKNFAYLANTVAAYRKVVDEEILKRGWERASEGESICDFEPNPSKTFSRGATEYFLEGKRGGVASFESPKSLGEKMGMVECSGDGWFAPAMGLAAGDGIVFGTEGIRVNSIDNQLVILNGNIEIPVGTTIFRNYDHRFIVALEHSRTRRVVDIAAHWILDSDRIKLEVNDGKIAAVIESYSQFQAAREPEQMLETIRTQTMRTGDTIFRMVDVAVETVATMPFLPVATINALRREVLKKLENERKNNPVRSIGLQPSSCGYPLKKLMPADNITNRLAEQFYRRHGVEKIEAGNDLQENLHGTCVMTTPYCIRREMDSCGKDNAPLYLVRGTKRYRLEFDCVNCKMNIYYE